MKIQSNDNTISSLTLKWFRFFLSKSHPNLNFFQISFLKLINNRSSLVIVKRREIIQLRGHAKDERKILEYDRTKRKMSKKKKKIKTLQRESWKRSTSTNKFQKTRLSHHTTDGNRSITALSILSDDIIDCENPNNTWNNE